MSTVDTFFHLKAAAVSAAVVPAASYVVPMWGVGPASFVLGAIGAVMSYVWELNQPTAKPRDTGIVLVFKTLFVMLYSVALVVVVPDIFDWTLDPRSEPPLTFIIALYGRHIYPALRKAIPNIVSGLGNAIANRGGGYAPPPDPMEPGQTPPPKDDDRGY